MSGNSNNHLSKIPLESLELLCEKHAASHCKTAKSFQVYRGALILLCAIQVSAECVPGHRETIRSGYTVEYRCGLYRSGETRNNVDSEGACATLCADSNPPRSICSYYSPTKRCIIGNPDGKDISYPGVTYMAKIEKPEDEDPFREDCKKEKDECLKRETALKADLAKCQGGPTEPFCPNHENQLYKNSDGRKYIIYCNLAMWGHFVTNGPRSAPGTSLSDCIKQCARISDCGNVNFNKKNECEFKTCAPPGDLAKDRRVTQDWNMAVLVH